LSAPSTSDLQQSDILIVRDDAKRAAAVDTYDRRHVGTQPYRNQRDVARFGCAEFYGWSEDKARQYATPARADFGAFVRAQGFSLD
jgi:FMN reductase [NAD(P)H]